MATERTAMDVSFILVEQIVVAWKPVELLESRT
jgi:hypothetical protein